jgi:transcriptional regulator with XRE-family HTH domain
MRFDYNRLKAERIARGYTIQDMADRLGISKGTYSKKERGKLPLTIEDFAKITNILNVPKENMTIFFTFDVDKMETNERGVVQV